MPGNMIVRGGRGAARIKTSQEPARARCLARTKASLSGGGEPFDRKSTE